jgi:predicted nucleic acid-binding protein
VIVISNTSPITNLAAVGQLAILQRLYETVFIPDAVYTELITGDSAPPGGTEVQTLSWIETKTVTNQALVTALQMELDPGEAAAIALAVELKADLLLLDERRGRTVAARFGLRFVGLLGLLIEAKRTGCLAAVKPILEDLVMKAGFWVSQQLYTRVLEAAGE